MDGGNVGRSLHATLSAATRLCGAETDLWAGSRAVVGALEAGCGVDGGNVGRPFDATISPETAVEADRRAAIGACLDGSLDASECDDDKLVAVGEQAIAVGCDGWGTSVAAGARDDSLSGWTAYSLATLAADMVGAITSRLDHSASGEHATCCRSVP